MEKPVCSQRPPPPRDLNLADASSPYAALSVDTSLFPAAFQARVLSELSQHFSDGLDAHLNGTLIHADNFQALNLLQARYREQVKCIYIDPPYNTGEDGFPYKDNYQSSSWLSMFECRLNLANPLLNSSGLLACHMDEHEHYSLEWLIRQIFQDGDMGKLIWDKRNPKGDSKGIAAQHEYVHFAVSNPAYLDNDEAFVRNKANAEAMLKKAEQLIKKYGVGKIASGEYKEWIRKNSNLSGGERAYNQLDENGDVFRPVSMAWPNKKTAPNDYFIPLIHPVTGKSCPVPARGWRNPPETMAKLLENNLILFGTDENTIPNRKYLLKENLTENVSSLYYMGSSDDELFKNMGISFENPKPIHAAQYFLSIMARPNNSLILDYFAGSGTTAHAVINLNREDGGNRKYILVEQGGYFDTVLKPRVQKVIYAENWKDGKPMPSEKHSRSADANPPLSDGINSETAAYALNTPHNGVSQIVKVLRLESYEDCLNNLALHNPNGDLFATLPEQARRDYVLRYMLDVESRGSLLNVAHFERPFDYVMEIAADSAGASVPTRVDLVETFNYLLGLTVVSVDDRRFDRGYVLVAGQQPNHAAGETTLILWRDCVRWPDDKLTELLEKLAINPQENEFAAVYVNGDHTLTTAWSNADGESGRLKIRQTEAAFLDLMFEGNV